VHASELNHTAIIRETTIVDLRPLVAAVFVSKIAQSSAETYSTASLGASQQESRMPETVELKDVRKRLWDEILAVHYSWAEYNYLFVESPERVAMLNACARWFFGQTQQFILREVILAISCLTDPVKSGDFENMVVEQLLTDPEIDTVAGLRRNLKRSIEFAKSQPNP